ncbi:MAG: hypothetical protein CBC57_01635 [Euryarchaeota archaeon TMED97]|nr:MAG: hypothetical protein CBC57_01635 [Euryarchaeota archaeon TMED97]|tara:strand:+ start:34446 stop:35417 length:972 start_codon:yes stop_codon:yes gene_type:complete
MILLKILWKLDMKQKLWIFGDSFADRRTNYREYVKNRPTDVIEDCKFKELGRADPVDIDMLDYTSTYVGPPHYLTDTEVITWEGWSYFLEDDYDVENFATAGIGGDTCFLRLTQQVDEVNKFTGDRVSGYPPLQEVSVVFILADIINRVPLTGYKDNQQWSFLFNTYPRKEYNEIMGNLSQFHAVADKVDTYSKYNKFAETFLMDHMETDEYKNRVKLFLGALDHYAGFFKNFICIPVGNYEAHWQGWSTNHKFHNMQYREDLQLETLSAKSEMPNKLYQWIFNYSKRNSKYQRPKHLYPNHLDSKYNGKIYNEIKQWMETSG